MRRSRLGRQSERSSGCSGDKGGSLVRCAKGRGRATAACEGRQRTCKGSVQGKATDVQRQRAREGNGRAKAAYKGRQRTCKGSVQRDRFKLCFARCRCTSSAFPCTLPLHVFFLPLHTAVARPSPLLTDVPQPALRQPPTASACIGAPRRRSNGTAALFPASAR